MEDLFCGQVAKEARLVNALRTASLCTLDQESRLLVDEGLRCAVGRIAAAGAVRRRDVGLEAAVLGRHAGVRRLLRLVAEVLRVHMVSMSHRDQHLDSMTWLAMRKYQL